jgi:hypothetical protein
MGYYWGQTPQEQLVRIVRIVVGAALFVWG